MITKIFATVFILLSVCFLTMLLSALYVDTKSQALVYSDKIIAFSHSPYANDRFYPLLHPITPIGSR